MAAVTSDEVRGASRRSGISIDGLTRLRLVDAPALSAYGELMAYVELGWSSALDRRIAEVVVAGASCGGFTGLRGAGTSGGHAGEKATAIWRSGATGFHHRPSWGPSARHLAFVSEASGHSSCLVADPIEGSTHEIARLEGAVSSLDWSPDGGRLAVCTTENLAPSTVLIEEAGRDCRVDGHSSFYQLRRHLKLVELDGTVWAPLGSGGGWGARFSPDGRQVALVRVNVGNAGDGTATEEQGTGIWCVSVGSGAARRLAVVSGGIYRLCWSPSGQSIAFIADGDLSSGDHNRHLYLLELASGAIADLTSKLDRSVGMAVRGDDARGCEEPALAWSANTDRIYFEFAEGGRGPIGWATPAGESGTLLAGDHVCLSPALARSGKTLAVVVTSCDDPGSLRLLNELDPEPTAWQLEGSNPWLDASLLGATRPVATNAPDGTPLEGWLTVPPPGSGNPPYPLLVSVHGGPHYAVGWRFTFEAQRTAAGGIAVLTCNPRGSLGYGTAFAAGTIGDWGGHDLGDVLALTDAATELADIDATRVAIGGVSYGGYLALWAITNTDRYCVAVSENGISDLLSQWGTGVDGGSELSFELGCPPWEDIHRYVERSPIRRADKVTTPLVLVHAELDRNCRIEQSEQMFHALRRLGREVALVVLPGEGHLVNLVGKPSSRALRASVVDNYLHFHLLGVSPDTKDTPDTADI